VLVAAATRSWSAGIEQVVSTVKVAHKRRRRQLMCAAVVLVGRRTGRSPPRLIKGNEPLVSGSEGIRESDNPPFSSTKGGCHTPAAFLGCD
jgi:hypothetical protein